nr:MAG TPA: hypothetical protein [Caudoviricetes sp.]
MTCEDCLYYERCKKLGIFNLETLSVCEDFTDRSEWVHLPCVAMVEQFIKDGNFDRRKTAHNGRIAVVYIDKKKWNSPLIDITEQFYNTDKAQERIKALEEKK